jgi:DNA polymerase-3 subunit beta
MKAVCIRSQLKEILMFAERNSGRSFNMPILQGVHIKAENNLLKITATNLDTGIEAEIPAKVQKEGETVVPVKILSQLISGMREDQVTLESVNNNLNISTERVSSFIKGYPAEEFPRIPKFKPNHSFDISCGELMDGLKKVVGSASSSSMKPEIASIFFYAQNRAPLKLVATDSFRLAEKTLSYSVQDINSFLLPVKNASELSRILENNEGSVNISFDNNQISFVTNALKFVSRLTEGVFPAYESIIPKKFATDVLVNKDEVVNALRAASIFSGNLREVSINILPDDNLMEIRTQYSEIGEHTSQLSAKITGEKISVNFNYNYLLDGLLNSSSDNILLRFAESNRPLLIQNPDNSSYLYLVMPMKNA